MVPWSLAGVQACPVLICCFGISEDIWFSGLCLSLELVGLVLFPPLFRCLAAALERRNAFWREDWCCVELRNF